MQYDPGAVMDCFGNFMVIWTDKRNGFYDTYAQRFNSSGAPLGSNFKLPMQLYGGIGSDCFGNFVIAWEGFGINAQRYNSTGTPLDTVFKVNDDVEYPWGNSHLWPAVSMDLGGDFVITWADNRNIYPFDIFAQRYDYQGHTLGSNFKVNSNYGADHSAPVVAMFTDRNFVISWPDQRNYSNHYMWDIYARVYSFSGSPVGPDFKVNDDTSPSNHSAPSIAMDSYNNFIITWQDQRNGNPDVYAQRFDSLGNPVGKNYLVPNQEYASFVQISPAVTFMNSNIFFAWTDNRRAKGYDVYAKVVDWSWTKVGEHENAAIPNSFELSQNYPNPFNPTTRIQFRVGSLEFGDPLNTTLKIYNILGQLVRTLVDEEKAPGKYEVIWDGKDVSGKEVSSGLYFYQLKTRDYIATKKMVLLR
ncbi:MAG: FlgD immunoglobulin-like domain containing protein [candidate division Zixibacteria bacterium]|nr:FlgD immunoglobulin-like domain containing protein [candidate division Zixibacteria bacterium]